MRLRIILIVWTLITIVAVVLLGMEILNKKPGTSQQQATHATLEQQNPELKDILDPNDEEKRLKAARKFVERVDVEPALEILYKSPLPNTGEGHLVVHQIGFYAYKKYGAEAMLKCKDYFLYACFHGAIIQAASDQGMEGISRMTDKCRGTYTRFFQCTHAAGHAFLAMTNYDLPKALQLCDDLYENDPDYPGTLSSCHNGAFMENIFGVHDWDTNKEKKREWLSNDRYFPCNYFGEKYQEGCWLNQASWMIQLNKDDVAKTTTDCEEIDNKEYTQWCIDNLSRQINPLTKGDPLKTFTLCKPMGTKWYDTCVIINAIAYYSVSGRDEALSICKKIQKDLKDDCYGVLFGPIQKDSLEKPEKEQICKKMEKPFNDECLTAMNPSQ
jgi:hypothetical protein